MRATALCCLVLCLCACFSQLSGERIACHVVHTPFLSNGETTYGIHVMNGDGRERKEIGKGRDPAWSPDGRKLVFVGSDDESLRVFDRVSGETVLLADIGAFVNHPAWSPDGESIAFVRA
ncbi:MAG: hypothetical protein GTN93_02510, partial [Anaerolineae bacterium]|nr:hypothetical protein [Anaerolineae bacterium]